jgi:Spy/CpxP family protein refolding chaperone
MRLNHRRNIMQIRRLFLFAFCFLFVSSIFLAAIADDENQNRKRIRENINTLRLLRMTQVLDLTEEQAAKIFPALNRIEKEKRGIHREIGQKMKELRLILAKEKTEEQEIESLIGDLKRLRNALKSQDEKLEKIMEENLTLVQRAKYFVFSVDFYRGLREKIDEARRLKKRSDEKDKR